MEGGSLHVAAVAAGSMAWGRCLGCLMWLQWVTDGLMAGETAMAE